MYIPHVLTFYLVQICHRMSCYPGNPGYFAAWETKPWISSLSDMFLPGKQVSWRSFWDISEKMRNFLSFFLQQKKVNHLHISALSVSAALGGAASLTHRHFLFDALIYEEDELGFDPPTSCASLGARKRSHQSYLPAVSGWLLSHPVHIVKVSETQQDFICLVWAQLETRSCAGMLLEAN